MADSSGAKANLRRRARRAHERAKADMVKALHDAAAKDTRQLSRSVRASSTTGSDRLSAKVDLDPRRSPATPDNYAVAAFNEFGTGPKVIRPRRAKALRFQVGGRTVFAKVVHQPARPGRPWWAPTVRRWGDTVRRAWRSSR